MKNNRGETWVIFGLGYNLNMIIFNEKYSDVMKMWDDHVLFQRIRDDYSKKIGFPSSGISSSWNDSINEVLLNLKNRNIHPSTSMLVEFKIPRDGSQIDLIFAGSNGAKDTIAIIELKRWAKVAILPHSTSRVRTNVGNIDNHYHPSYQLTKYFDAINNLDKTFFKGIDVERMVYMHNYEEKNDVINNVIYKYWTNLSPVYTKIDKEKFASKLESLFNSKSTIDYEKKFSDIKYDPSTSLINNAKKINKTFEEAMEEFNLMGSQVLAFESISNTIRENNNSDSKFLFILRGAAGSGKTVVALKLYLDLMYINSKIPTRLVFPTEAFRETMKRAFNLDKNSEVFRKISGSPVQSGKWKKGEFDVAIVDEAHKYQTKANITGLDQLKETIKTHNVTVLLMDDDQSISKKAVGKISDVIAKAKKIKKDINIDIFSLEGQFRCNGGFEYNNWLDGWLKNHHDHTEFTNTNAFSIQVANDEEEFTSIYEKDNEPNRRLLTSFTFPWTKNVINDGPQKDVKIGSKLFAWNPHNIGTKWNNYSKLSSARKKELRKFDFNLDDELAHGIFGYQNTVQGSEFQKVYLYIGDDLYFEDGIVKVRSEMNLESSSIWSLKNKKGQILEDAIDHNRTIILNAYYIMLTRAKRGVVICAKDKALNDHLKSLILVN